MQLFYKKTTPEKGVDKTDIEAVPAIVCAVKTADTAVSNSVARY